MLMARHHPTGKFTHLGAWLLLTLILSGCNIAPATAKVFPTPPSRSTFPSSPTLNVLPTNTMLPLTPTVRPILTPLSTIDIIPSTTKPACRPLGVASTLPYPGKVGQVWYAEQIVIGSVIAQETRWEGNKGYQFVTTYSLFRVEERLRGKPAAEILVTQRAGTLDGCTQLNSDRPLNRDERLLLFLKFSNTQASRLGPPIYYIMFGDAGIYNFSYNTSGTPTASFVTEIRQILSQPPPADLSSYWIVPLDRAPLVPKPTATPQR